MTNKRRARIKCLCPFYSRRPRAFPFPALTQRVQPLFRRVQARSPCWRASCPRWSPRWLFATENQKLVTTLKKIINLGSTSLRPTTPTSRPMAVTYAWFTPSMLNRECTFSREVRSTSWKGAGSMGHFSNSTAFRSSASSHCFWSSGDMSITLSRG